MASPCFLSQTGPAVIYKPQRTPTTTPSKCKRVDGDGVVHLLRGKGQPRDAPLERLSIYTTHAVSSMAFSADVEALRQIAADIQQAFSAGGSLYNSAFRNEYVQNTGDVVAFDFGRMGAQACGIPTASSLAVSMKGLVGGSDAQQRVTIALRGGAQDAVFCSVMPADDAGGWVACMMTLWFPAAARTTGNRASAELLRRIDVVLGSLVGCRDRFDGS